MNLVEVLKESDKSKVSLVFDPENQRYYVEKVLFCPIETYKKLQKISSPFLPKIFLVEEREGKTYVLEEFIKGRALDQIKPTKSQENLWMKELFQAISLLHDEKLIHRDIKPSNILLGEDGHIRLIDFDAVREETQGKDSDTRLLGTQGYAPPEQYGFSSTDVRADIYALGVTMKEILENRPCHRKIIEKCTNFSPHKRYSSVEKLNKVWHWRYFTWLISILKPLLILPVLLLFYWGERADYTENIPETAAFHPLSPLNHMVYYGSNEDGDSNFLLNESNDFQGIHLEFQQIGNDFFATVYYTKQKEGWASLCYFQGDSLLPVTFLDENTYEIPFDQRGMGRLQEDYQNKAQLILTVNPLGELFFTLSEDGVLTVDHMSLKSSDVWRNGEFFYYVMDDSAYEDPSDGENEVHPFQIIKIFGQSIYQTWRNDNEVRKISSGDIHILSCEPHVLAGIQFTYYEKDDLSTVHTARSPTFVNEIYLDGVHFVKFSEY